MHENGAFNILFLFFYRVVIDDRKFIDRKVLAKPV